MRRRTDRLYRRYVDRLGPREREALERIEAHPGITVEQLADEMGVTVKRVWQYSGISRPRPCGARATRRAGSGRGRAAQPTADRAATDGPR